MFVHSNYALHLFVTEFSALAVLVRQFIPKSWGQNRAIGEIIFPEKKTLGVFSDPPKKTYFGEFFISPSTGL